MHYNEIDNRLLKAQRFLKHVDTHLPGATARTLSLLGDDSWKMLADQAGEKELSKATISTVIALVRGRELAVEAVLASMTPDAGVQA
jgi:hypothetical protein